MIGAILIAFSVFAAPQKEQDSVYVFFTPSCPVCKSSTPVLRDLREQYPNIAFVAVVDSAASDEDEMKSFLKKHELSVPVRWDSDSLAARFGATTTPEVVVLHNGRRVYQGRIDNQYEALGKRRRVVTVHDLRDVLSVLESGMVPSFRRTKPVGCYLEK